MIKIFKGKKEFGEAIRAKFKATPGRPPENKTELSKRMLHELDQRRKRVTMWRMTMRKWLNSRGAKSRGFRKRRENSVVTTNM